MYRLTFVSKKKTEASAKEVKSKKKGEEIPVESIIIYL
jgi:hypothetical protein